MHESQPLLSLLNRRSSSISPVPGCLNSSTDAIDVSGVSLALKNKSILKADQTSQRELDPKDPYKMYQTS